MKKTLAQNWLIILLIVLIIGIGVLIWGKNNREKKEEEIRQINEILDSEIGKDGIDIKSTIQGVQADSSFNAIALAKQIYSAKGWVNDDEDAVYAAFANRTRAQIATIYKTFLNEYGQDLDKYLLSFLDAKEYENVIRIIHTSR